MINIKVKAIKSFNYRYFHLAGILFFIFFYVFSIGPTFAPDSQSYIENSLFRTPVYPLIIDFFQLFFKEYFAYPLILFQAFILFLSALFFVKKSIYFFNLSYFLEFCLLVFLISPIFVPMFLVSGVANSITTESIAYSFFLLYFGTIIEYLRNKNKKDLFLIFLISILLYGTRPQFIFLFPINILLIFIFIRERENR